MTRSIDLIVDSCIHCSGQGFTESGTGSYMPEHHGVGVMAPCPICGGTGKLDLPPDNRPQDGRVCDCEDAPCCGHYDL